MQDDGHAPAGEASRREVAGPNAGARRAGAWNEYDDAAAAGILAAARAVGSTGVSVRYGEVSWPRHTSCEIRFKICTRAQRAKISARFAKFSHARVAR